MRFVDKLCPYLIAKWPSMSYWTPGLVELLCDLAARCATPKTCFALLDAIQTNPDSPYVGETFFLRSKSRYFYEHFVLPAALGFAALLLRAKTKSDIEKHIAKINADYVERLLAGGEKLQRILAQWSQVRGIVDEVDNTQDTRVVA